MYLKLFSLISVSLLLVSCAKELTDSEEVTARFARALNNFEVEAMAEEMHTDALDFFKQYATHLASTPNDEEGLKQMFDAFEVSNIAELKSLDSKTATIRFFRMAFGLVRQEVKDVAVDSKIEIIGNLADDDNFYVLYRTDFTVQGMEAMIPSVIVLREEGGKLKVINTTQMETLKAKAYAKGLKKESE